MIVPKTSTTPENLDRKALGALLAGRSTDPHALLGVHPTTDDSGDRIVCAWHPEAVAAMYMLPDGSPRPLARVDDTSLFTARVGRATPLGEHPRIRFEFHGGATSEREDPYSFLPTVGEQDQYFFGEGTHRRLWEVLGANPKTVDGVPGISFAVWAPAASAVALVGEFSHWDGRVLPMRALGSSGIFELFLPRVESGSGYKYEIKTADGEIRMKADPFASWAEVAPGTASRVAVSGYSWGDGAWMEARPERDVAREPMAAYEVHLGSWARVAEDGNRSLSYREIAPRLIEHVTNLGFTHIELLPVSEHPFEGSWGYQTTGYYAPTSRLGHPDDFRYFVDECHQAGIGVILDWVPAHFPKDDFALRRFDGTALFEHEDPRLGEHPDWGTQIFNYGRNEVRNFLVANALFWLDEFHIDGLRVDAVASMLYLDYSRKEGEWVPNRHGGRENLEALEFLRELNSAVATEQPGCFTIAEESTAWPGVTAPIEEGGLGFALKWNMGWMHDTLAYFAREPVHRSFHHDELTFAMLYEGSERFVMPLSHDEVVHMKGSLVEKMPGDWWQKLANLRLLLAYQWLRPGKKLVFMGVELAQNGEWDHDGSLDWHLSDEPGRRGMSRYMSDLGRIYRSHPCLWRTDPDPTGYQWIEPDDGDNSVLSFLRWDGSAHLAVILNFTPVPREPYRVGVPTAGEYEEILSSDADLYGGSGHHTAGRHRTEHVPMHGFAQSVTLTLPPLAAVVLRPSH